MIFRHLYKLVRQIAIGLALLLLLVCVLFALLQTKWAKEQIRLKIAATLKEMGIDVSAEELSGQPPFTWTLKSADVIIGKNQELKFSNLKMRIAILPLFSGRIEINYLKVEDLEYSFSFAPQSQQTFSLEDAKSLIKQQFATPSFPFQIAIHHLIIEHVTVINRHDNSKLSFGLDGKAMIRQDRQEFGFDLHILSADQKTTYMEAELIGSRPRNFIETKLKLHLDAFPAFIMRDIEGKVAFEMNLQGPWDTWEAVLYDKTRTSAPLSGKIKGVIADIKIPQLPFLDHKWKFLAQFSIPSGDQLYFQNALLSSDLVQLRGKGRLSSHLEKSQVMLAFSFPDLSLFSPQLSFSLAGKADGKALYQDGGFKASVETQDFKCDGFAAMSTRGLIKGSKEGNEWEGEVKFSSSDAQVPFENSFAFDYTPNGHLSIIDFSLTLPDGNASGFLTYDIPHRLFDGSLFANLEHIERLAQLFQQENIDGAFALELQCSSNQEQQDVKCVLVGRDLRYRELLLDDVTVSAEILDLHDRPQGRFSLLAENFYSPNLYLSRLNFGTSSDEESWPFFLDAEGRIENPFQCYAKGFWRKENPLFTLELTQFFGDLALIPFALKHPTELEWGADYLNLSPFAFRIGEGHLYTHFELSPVRSLGKWDLTHFPLEILSCLKPRFALKGFLSSNGFFDADTTNFEGAVNAAIEQANVLHFGKKQPFQARGTIQAHLNQKRGQLHTDLHASDDQFFDLNASLPFSYQLYPFNINLDDSQPTSAELIAEGKLEDLFDFVNLGANNFTGLISCRLFLSQPLASPALQGKLEWQNGTFENYFTGISLKEINAQFEAQSDTVHLTQLTASDDKQGSISAQGKILLKPKEFFPYSVEVEMRNLHALEFDMIDCNLTGPLYLTGDMHQMLTQGNLLVDEAMIQITERLPYEVPTLPVTYINRPPHLYSKTVVAKPNFTSTIDLELTAEDKVFVEGSGLKAELQGNVRLRGTDSNITASGALKLMKGEYQFAGKVFKLTEGEILFNDKPTPSAYLNLNGTLSMPDITITAMLRGPLMSPQLTFQSNPQKPTSEILSLILFNKDIGEISHAEAIQLASTLVSLSGGAGPDMIETIRKSIGIDRLNIAARKKGTGEESGELALEIGKYLTRGIMITLSQSATSSQVIVEVELPRGFVFQAETQEEEEGKFSLKWTKSY